MTDHRWNPRTVLHIDAFRSGYLMVGIKCDEAMLQEIDRDGQISQFTANQIKEAFNIICDGRRSRGQEIFLRHVSPMTILWHLKSARGDNVRHVKRSTRFERDPQRIYYDDAIGTLTGLPKLAQDFAMHLFLQTDDGKLCTRVWDTAEERSEGQGQRRADLLKSTAWGSRGFFERWGAATLAARIMRNEQHPKHGEMLRLIQAEGRVDDEV